MARRRVELHSAARQEIRTASAWYRERSLSAEDGFLAELRHAVEQVSIAPDRWPFFRAGTRRYVFNRYPYSLFYRIVGDVVRILAVAHDKRREGYWTSRR